MGPSLVGQGKSLGFLRMCWAAVGMSWKGGPGKAEGQKAVRGSWPLGPRPDPRAGSPARLGRACSFRHATPGRTGVLWPVGTPSVCAGAPGMCQLLSAGCSPSVFITLERVYL